MNGSVWSMARIACAAALTVGACGGQTAATSAGDGGAGDGGSSGSVVCGTGACAGPAQYCCAVYQTPTASHCEPAAQSDLCTGSVSIAMLCDGPEDCGGTFCCGFNGSGLPFVGTVHCAATCALDAMHERFCRPAQPDACPSGYACKPTPLPSNYFSCRPL